VHRLDYESSADPAAASVQSCIANVHPPASIVHFGDAIVLPSTSIVYSRGANDHYALQRTHSGEASRHETNGSVHHQLTLGPIRVGKTHYRR
jgi:hypothetical protein